MCFRTIEKGIDLKTPDELGLTVEDVIYTDLICDIDLLKASVGRGADVNATGGQFGTALQAAVYLGRLDFVEALLKHGADVNARSGVYGCALLAAEADDTLMDGEDQVEMIALLQEHGAERVPPDWLCQNKWAKTPDGWTWVTEERLIELEDAAADGGWRCIAPEDQCLLAHLPPRDVLLEEEESKGDNEGGSREDSEGESEVDSNEDSEGESNEDSKQQSKGDNEEQSKEYSEEANKEDSEHESKENGEEKCKGNTEQDSERDVKEKDNKEA